MRSTPDGSRVAFKRISNTADVEAKARLAREIDVLRNLSHRNIIEILDSDSSSTWYTMPIAVGTLRGMVPPIATEALLVIVSDMINALECSASKGYVHRDITPNNILHLQDSAGDRWVLADWGLVRRPAGQTTVRLTAGQVGTEGFIAPEAWVDGHRADILADIYALGRVVAWARTGKWPVPNVDLRLTDEWLMFTSRAAAMNPQERPKDAAALRQLLKSVRPLEETVDVSVTSLISRYRESGDDALLVQAIALALQESENRDLWWFTINEFTIEELSALLVNSESRFSMLLRTMEQSVQNSEWRGVNFDHANELIYFFQKCASACIVSNNLGMLAECCNIWFPLDIKWDRWRQKTRSCRFLRSLKGQEAEVVARILRATEQSAEYYGSDSEERWLDADPRIRKVLKT